MVRSLGFFFFLAIYISQIQSWKSWQPGNDNGYRKEKPQQKPFSLAKGYEKEQHSKIKTFIQLLLYTGSQVAQWQRIRLPMQETQFRSLGQEDPLKKEMATHRSILASKNPWTEEPGGLQSMGLQRLRHDLTRQVFEFRFKVAII